MDYKLKEQEASLELEQCLCCVAMQHCTLTPPTHTVAMFAHQDHQMEVVMSNFPEVPTVLDMTRPETLMSFLQIKYPMGLNEKIWQVKHEICQSRREMAHVVAGGHCQHGKPLKSAVGVLEGPHHRQWWPM
jgi:hypothetical protein